MTQTPVSIPTSGPLPGLTLVQNVNNALASLSSQFSGPAAPAAAGLGLASLAGLTWYDTTANTLWVRNQADTAWMPKLYVNETSGACWSPDFDGWIVTDPHSYASATSTTVPGNQTGRYAAGRRLRAVGATTGTIYGKVTAASYAAGTTLTTITVLWDSGALVNETLTVSTGIGVTGKTLDVSAIAGLSVVPSGLVGFFAGATAPSGWLKANGALVSRTAYAALFTAIGTTFGAGDGATTFALPDLRGEFVRGLDDGRGVDAARALGSWQAQSYQDHSHAIGVPNSASSTGGTVAGNYGYTAGVSGPTGETRPRNVALLACIKY